ncbi:MAG: site-2 protease family protein [Candidatus Micrarchaeota archaeon]|nr:site-2 protease family protein [Candidatus Micrarchaeota archaeon]
MAFSINFNLMGIEIELHWSLMLLLLLILASGGIDEVITISILFVFVILHELSHSYVAIKNGVDVKKITLFPIGGMAMIDEASIPPDVEFKISIAGPLFNFIVVFLALFLQLLINDTTLSGIFSITIQANLVLGLFNLLPAIPLDGGRVWRSIREKKVGHLRATVDAVKLSKFIVIILITMSLLLAVEFDAFGLLLWNALIAAIIWIGSESELNVAILLAAGRNLFVRDVTNFSPLLVGAKLKLKDCFSLMYSINSPAVVVSSKPPRVLSYRQLSGIEKSKWGIVSAADVAQICPACELNDPLLDAWKRMRSSDLSLLPVVFDGEIIGTISEMDVEKRIVLNRLKTLEQF